MHLGSIINWIEMKVVFKCRWSFSQVLQKREIDWSRRTARSFHSLQLLWRKSPFSKTGISWAGGLQKLSSRGFRNLKLNPFWKWVFRKFNVIYGILLGTFLSVTYGQLPVPFLSSQQRERGERKRKQTDQHRDLETRQTNTQTNVLFGQANKCLIRSNKRLIRSNKRLIRSN